MAISLGIYPIFRQTQMVLNEAWSDSRDLTLRGWGQYSIMTCCCLRGKLVWFRFCWWPTRVGFFSNFVVGTGQEVYTQSLHRMRRSLSPPYSYSIPHLDISVFPLYSKFWWVYILMISPWNHHVCWLSAIKKTPMFLGESPLNPIGTWFFLAKSH